MTGPLRPRPRPCRSCPYRRDCPSGVWAAETYDRAVRGVPVRLSGEEDPPAP